MTSTSSLPDDSRPGRRPRPPRGLRSPVAPKKALGQHFLTDGAILARIVAAADLAPDSIVIEVGPGTGSLTGKLCDAAATVIAVEVDPTLCQILTDQLQDRENVVLIEADVLARAPAELLAAVAVESDYVVVGNLPFNIAAAVLRHFLEAERPPSRLVVMLQREVAASVTAAPGRLGLLGVSVQIYAAAQHLFDVAPDAFYPAPKVTSSVIRLDTRPEPLVPIAERDRFFAAVRAGFSAPRKQLRNSLAVGLHQPPAAALAAIEAAGLDPACRPQELSINDWRRLARQVG